MDLVYFIVLCSVLIFVHELGHFVWAKIFGVKVLTFSIGFGPKLLRLRGRETEYCIGLFPFGGFVKMLEETRQDPVLPEDKKRTFEAQALWKRIIIVLAGPAMNIVFPVILYFAVFVGESDGTPPTVGEVLPGYPAEDKLMPGDRVLEVDGERIYTFSELRRHINEAPGQELTLKVFRDYEHVEVTVVPRERRIAGPLETEERIGEVGIGPHRPAAVIGISDPESPAYRAGLRTFDVVTAVRGQSIATYDDLEQALLKNRGATVPITYLRPSAVPSALGGYGEFAVYEAGVAALTPDASSTNIMEETGIDHAGLFVAEVIPGSPEWEADLRVGDRIVEVDGTEVTAWSTVQEMLLENAERPHTLTWIRNGQRRSGTIELRHETYVDDYGDEYRRPVLLAKNWSPVVPEADVENPNHIKNAFVRSVEETYNVVRFIVIGITRVVEGKVSVSTLGGPITIYDVVGQERRKGVSYFIWAMAVISINLGLINLLPIPILDGGHLVFFGFEAILRKPLPLRVREVLSFLGLVALLVIMGVAFKNDLERREDVIKAHVDELIN